MKCQLIMTNGHSDVMTNLQTQGRNPWSEHNECNSENLEQPLETRTGGKTESVIQEFTVDRTVRNVMSRDGLQYVLRRYGRTAAVAKEEMVDKTYQRILLTCIRTAKHKIWTPDGNDNRL